MKINERILNDSEFIKDLSLCQLRLIKDGDLDWFLLIPMVEGMVEWVDLDIEQQKVLCQEISLVSRQLKNLPNTPDKINVASLGNMVPQLHIHVLARYKSDRAWPGAIWGSEAQGTFSHDRVNFWKERFK